VLPNSIKNKFHFLKALGAVFYYGYPARKLNIIGVTGTDGKTTTSTMIYHLLRKTGEKVALVSTVAAYIGDVEISTGLHVTSPSPWFLQKFMKETLNKGCKYLVLETTSHGLAQHRLLGTNVAVAVLTNITHEHLDYHKNYSKYFEAKSKLFRGVDVAILNKEDFSYIRMKKVLRPKTELIAYDRKTLKGKIRKAAEEKFPEPYNLLNATASILLVQQLGVENSNEIIKGIKSFSGVKGRMEEVKNDKGIKIIVDFAHTPKALESVLSYLRKKKAKNKRLITVFGCAGERDIEKRVAMGKISGKLSDISVITAEDPRHEDVNKIIEQIVEGMKIVKAKEFNFGDNLTNNRYFIRIPERGKAIHFAINKLARRGDTVVVCGKGHEQSLAYGKIEYSWSERKAINRALSGKILQTALGFVMIVLTND